MFVNDDPFSGDSDGTRPFYRGPRGRNGLAWLETRRRTGRLGGGRFPGDPPEVVERLMGAAQNPQEQTVPAPEDADPKRGRAAGVEWRREVDRQEHHLPLGAARARTRAVAPRWHGRRRGRRGLGPPGSHAQTAGNAAHIGQEVTPTWIVTHWR